MMLRCENEIRSCGTVEHILGARYWICNNCGALGVNRFIDEYKGKGKL